jgi:hypothetical protein
MAASAAQRSAISYRKAKAIISISENNGGNLA